MGMLENSLNKETGRRSEEEVGLTESPVYQLVPWCFVAGCMPFFSCHLLFPTECRDEFRRLMTVCSLENHSLLLN